MKILSLTSYAVGFTGIVERPDAYVLFCFPRRGAFKTLHAYPKADFNNGAHFRSVITRLLSPGSFLKSPVSVRSVTTVELDRIFRYISGRGSNRSRNGQQSEGGAL